MIRADFSQLRTFINGFRQAEADLDVWLRDFLIERAFRVIAKTKQKTPVDTGALRNMWQIGSVTVSGSDLEVEIFNNMEYASFVERGHRTTGGGWVDGRFMLTISIFEVISEMPAAFDTEFRQFLRARGAY